MCKFNTNIFFTYFALLLIALVSCKSTENISTKYKTNSSNQPNVILILTDDQGYGDLGCHGNPIIKTPALDSFYKKVVRLTDFHTEPFCSPTRAGLMTGRYANRTGVWHTYGGFSILRKEELTVADVFKQGGYETGIFGKWHLGDAYPSRPQDKGFNYSIIHGGGGIGQTQDYWNNDYFDDTYLVNGVLKKFKGYCTDIWFDEAISYIESVKDKPFFCYISTNAPHSPFNVPDKYYDLYRLYDIPKNLKRFYGMITNIDDNFRKLQLALKRMNIEDNTILIFMTDNGTAMRVENMDDKWYGYNSKMRGSKGSVYEGGHRVPFFISYPKGGIGGGRDVGELTASIDVLPLLMSICKLKRPNRDFDGIDILPVIEGKAKTLNRKYIVTDYQRIQEPKKGRRNVVMADKWRLVNGKELFNIEDDSNQSVDLAGQYPEKVEVMRNYYEEWWTHVSTKFSEFPTINVGSKHQNPVSISCADAHTNKIPWNQYHIKKGKINSFGGYYSINFEKAGYYEISISRWPFESSLDVSNKMLSGSKPSFYIGNIPIYLKGISGDKGPSFVSGGVKVDDWVQTKNVKQGETAVNFEGYFQEGIKSLNAWFTNSEEEDWGAYYVKITNVNLPKNR